MSLVLVDAGVGPLPEFQSVDCIMQLTRLQELFEPATPLVRHQDVLDVICPSIQVLGGNVGGARDAGRHSDAGLAIWDMRRERVIVSFVRTLLYYIFFPVCLGRLPI